MMDKKRVLIVDDVPTNLHLLSSLLKSKYTVAASTSGQKAIELANNDPKPDIILLDVYMPEMNGFEVCEKLRSDEYTKDIPVVFVSSMDDEDEYNKAKQFGDKIDFVQKPVTGKVIDNMIEKYTAKIIPTELEEDCKNGCVISFDESELEEPSDEKASILVVDDTPENIKVIVEILKKQYKVSVATNGKNALKLLDDGLKPDLILLDVIMPELDGFQTCEILKADKKYKDIPVVFLTILENEQDIVKGFEVGAVDYVTKPVEPTVLKARITTHLKLKNYQSRLLDSLQKKEELLIKQSKMATLGEMFENITHQWRQPLSTITLASDTIKMYKEMDTLDDESLSSNISAIKDSAEHLADTVEGFRDFLKEDTQKQYFSIKDVIEKSLSLLSAKFKNQGINIDQSNLEDIEINTYKNDLIQVLMNILNNGKDALEHIESNKTLRVYAQKEDNSVIIKVIDNGGGIKDEHMDQLFCKYFTTKPKDKGTGIGLYMSKALVENHLGGSIKGYNVDDGACFEITLSIN